MDINKPYKYYSSPELKRPITIEQFKSGKVGKQVPVVDLDLFIDDMKLNGEVFKLAVTTFTKKLDCQYGTFKYSQKGSIKEWELYFISKVKKHIMSLESFPDVRPENLQYIKNFIVKEARYTKQLHEIDLSAAYWSITHSDGYLTDDLYNEGLKLSKKIRLVSLGALAKRVTTMDFNGLNFENIDLQPLSPAATVFFNATKRVSQLMNEARAICGLEAMFIWSDAIFFKGDENLIKLKYFFKEKGVNFKSFKIDAIKYKNHVATVTSLDYAFRNEDKKEDRPFNFKIMEL